VKPQKWIVTFFGAGLVPVAPGTAGSIAAGLVLYAIAWSDPGELAWQSVLLAGLIVAAAANVRLGPWAIAHFRRLDPQPMVIDEVAGVCLTALLLPAAAW
jgi:phosphatidylglycerophosphatase A